jgi:enoyl-CoA hydratase
VQRQHDLDAAYAGNDVSVIIERMRASAHEDDRTVAEVIAARSPLALSVTLEALRRAAAYESLDDALRIEFRLACRSLRWPDFAEGVRAQVIDKDRSPRWNPAPLDGVDAHEVLRAFAPLDDHERADLATTEWSPR